MIERESPTEWGTVVGYDLVLIDEAQRCVARARAAEANGDADVEAGSTCAAILCAAAACEALLSEEVTSMELPGRAADPDDFVSRVRRGRSCYEQWRVFLRGIKHGSEIIESVAYQDLVCLVKLRNHIAHRRAGYLPKGQWPDELSECIGSRHLPIRETPEADWTSVVLVADVANWAYEKALAWMQCTASFTPNARTVRGALGRDAVTLSHRSDPS